MSIVFKSIAILFVTMFALSVFLKGVGFFIVEYIKPSSFVEGYIEAFCAIIVVCISFFNSAIIIGRRMSKVVSFITPSLFLIVIAIFAINDPIFFERKTRWVTIFICVIFSFLSSYYGAHFGEMQKRERKSKN